VLDFKKNYPTLDCLSLSISSINYCYEWSLSSLYGSYSKAYISGYKCVKISVFFSSKSRVIMHVYRAKTNTILPLIVGRMLKKRKSIKSLYGLIGSVALSVRTNFLYARTKVVTFTPFISASHLRHDIKNGKNVKRKLQK
jgi:hypothetical protein